MIRAIKGDITKVTGFQAIVNSANNSLLGGAGVDGAIHRAAGPQLRTECRRLNGCETGESRITLGYNLPCNHIIHSVGPVWMGGTAGEEELLRSCYISALTLALENNIRKIAFSAISSGEYGYPAELSSKVAVAAVFDFLKDNPDSFDDICWVVPDDNSASVYAAEIKAATPKKTEPKKKKAAKKAEVAEEVAESAEEAAENDKEVAENAEESAEGVGKDTVEDSVDSSSEGAAEDSEGSEDSTSGNKAEDGENATDSSADGTEEISDNTAESSADESEKSEKAPENTSQTPSTNSTVGSFHGAIWNRYDINWLIREVDSGKKLTYTCFWHANENSENNILSTWYGGRLIFINGRKYDTVEQYLMSEMALLFRDMGTYELIMAEPDPNQCKKYARNIQHFDEAAWQMIFKEVIFHGNVGKAISDKEFAKALLATGDSILVEASPFDDIYGAGMKESELLNEDGTLKVHPREWRAYKSERQAENALGFVLMAVRDYLRMFTE